MSNKDFEEKVLKALGTLQTDVARLDRKVDSLDNKVTRLDNKIDSQTYELKMEMSQQTAYLNQAFVNISRIDQERFIEKDNV